MGQKRAKPSQELEADQIRRTMPFYLPRSSKICAGELKGWVADETNEHRDTLLMDARDAGPLTRLYMHIFACFLRAGVVPSLSSFLGYWRSMGYCCRSFTQTPSWLCQSSSTSARLLWGFTHRSRSSTITTK
jgi:hypothetical protein